MASWIVRGSAYIAAAGMLAVATAYAYWRAFSVFAAYDDEGYVIQTIRSYLEGHRLFDDVFTQYGPAFYVIESVVHRTLGAPLTHDFERFATIGLWVAASASCAATVQRLTRAWTVAALTFVGVFLQLTTLVNEPGHPQGLLVLVIALVVLVAARDRGEGEMGVAAVGVLTAIALLVKINVGTYLAFGFALPVLLSSRLPRSRAITVMVAIVTAVACLLPLAATRNDVPGWALNYALVTCLSLASTIAVIAAAGRRSLSPTVTVRYVAIAAGACALLLLPALVRGTSISSLVTGIIVRPSQFASLFRIMLILPTSSVLLAGAGLLLSLAFVASVRFRRPPPAIAIGIAKIAVAGVGLWLSGAGYVSLLTYFTPLLWVLAVPSGDDSSDQRGVGRSVLALVAVFESLQAYPVAGSQLAFASFLMIPAAFVCAHDGFAILGRYLGRSRVWPWAVQASFILTGFLLYSPLLDPRPWRAAYDAGYEMRLGGTERLRLPAGFVALYHWLSGTVAANCDSLLTLPGLNSFNAWSGIDPVSDRNVTAWMKLLSGTEQESIWAAVDRANRPCVIYSAGLANGWLGGGSIETLPAHREMRARFRQVAESAGYHLFMREKDVPPSGAFMGLLAGRRVFERRRSPIPIRATFAVDPRTATLRAWIRSRRTGVILGCQSLDYRLASSHWLPMLYIGRTGRLYGQHWTAGLQAQASEGAVNDGNWHHVALVREQDDQRLYVDGSLVGRTHAKIETRGLDSCQAGTGNTSFWPDAPRAAMPFDGEIEGLGVSLSAWSASQVAEDQRTKPN